MLLLVMKPRCSNSFGRDVLDDDGDHVSPDGCISDAVDALTDDGFADLTFDDGFVDQDDAALI